MNIFLSLQNTMLQAKNICSSLLCPLPESILIVQTYKYSIFCLLFAKKLIYWIVIYRWSNEKISYIWPAFDFMS